MMKIISLTVLTALAMTLPSWAHEQVVEHAHAGGLTIYAVPAFAIAAAVAVVGFVAWSSRTNKEDN